MKQLLRDESLFSLLCDLFMVRRSYAKAFYRVKAPILGNYGDDGHLVYQQMCKYQ